MGEVVRKSRFKLLEEGEVCKGRPGNGPYGFLTLYGGTDWARCRRSCLAGFAGERHDEEEEDQRRRSRAAYGGRRNGELSGSKVKAASDGRVVWDGRQEDQDLETGCVCTCGMIGLASMWCVWGWDPGNQRNRNWQQRGLVC